MVKLIRTIKDNYEEGQVFTEIFDGLSLSGTGWALGCTTSEKLKCVSQSHVSTISQSCNDQTTIVTLILAAVVESGIELVDFDGHDVGLTLCLRVIFYSVESELGLPFEVFLVCNGFVGVQLLDNLAIVLLHSDQRDHLQAVDISGGQLDAFDEQLCLFLPSRFESFKRIFVSDNTHGLQSLVNLTCPVYLKHGSDDLAACCGDSLHHLARGLLFSDFTLGSSVLMELFFNHVLHFHAQIVQPDFYLGVHGNLEHAQLDDFVIGWAHEIF